MATAALARSAPEAAAALDGCGHLLNYVVPSGMHISEVPMHLPEGETFGHAVPEDRDPALYKVIFTEAIVDGPAAGSGGAWLRHAVNKTPLVEVHVDLRAVEVTAVYPPPADPFYGSRQVPVF